MPKTSSGPTSSNRDANAGNGSRPPIIEGSPAEAQLFSDLIGDIYDAALEHSRWPSVLAKVGSFVPGCMANLLVNDTLDNSASQFVTWGDSPHFTALYLAKYAKMSPMFPEALSFPIGEVFATEDILPASAIRTTPFYEECMQPQGYVDLLGTNIDRSATGVAMLAVARHETNGMADAASRRRLALLAPHMRRAVLIGKIIDLSEIKATAFAKAIDGLAAGVFLVDARGSLVHVNVAGQDMLASGDPLQLAKGVLMASQTSVERELRQAFAAAGRGDGEIETGGVAVTFQGPSGDHFVAHVLPLTAGSRRELGFNSRAAAALFVRKRSADFDSAIETTTQLYGFTPAEVRVLRALIDAGSIEATASSLGTSKSTVKTHLEHLFKKTGTKRQADLVKLLAGFSSTAA